MTNKELLEAIIDGKPHAVSELTGEHPLAVQELILQAQWLKDKRWLDLARNNDALGLSQLLITPEGKKAAPNCQD